MHVPACLAIHANKQERALDASSGVTHAVVLKLIEGLEQKGHHVCIDNYYSGQPDTSLPSNSLDLEFVGLFRQEEDAQKCDCYRTEEG